MRLYSGIMNAVANISLLPPRGEEMREPEIFHTVMPDGFRPSLAYGSGKLGRTGEGLFLLLVCILMTPVLMSGCGHGGLQAKPTFEEANDLFSQGNYGASLNKYGQLIEHYPEARDRVLFEMGIIHSYPKNERKDYKKSLECFGKIIRDYPGSGYRRDSETMIFSINNVIFKDRTIAEQQTQIESLRQEARVRENENAELQQKIKEVEQKVVDFAVRKRAVDRILIEKNERRLTLMSNGEVLKAYRIALGGNPNGPKERQGDNRTPEGTYIIDSRNSDSDYHLSLHISYPNERDRKRAKKLGVSPGGNIMIHGLRKGCSWVGESHADIDWTKGCIAVTDEEIEEIYKLAPVGTTVEIKP